jgi:hypothetical protein
MDGQPTGPQDTWTPAEEVPEADVQEQRQDLAAAPADPEVAVGRTPGAVAGSDPDVDVLPGANEADIAEQLQEVPYDDDFER